MNPKATSPLPLPELYWRGLILALSVAVTIITAWCLTHGITTVFMHLYYFPIILLAYRYRWKGCGLAILLSLGYLSLVIVFSGDQADIVIGAWYRFLVFAGIAAVVAYLSDRLEASRCSLQQFAEIRDQYLSLAPAIILVLDRNGTITFLNRRGGSILECQPDEVIGKSWFDRFLPEKDRDRVRRAFLQLIDGQVEQNRRFENPVLTCTGTEKIIRWYNTVLHDEKGTITGTLGFGEDITEEKWAQDSLWEMHQFQESVIANANVWITVLEPDGTILEWNEAAESISGYRKTDVLGKKTVWKNLYPDYGYRKKVTGDIQRIIGRDTFLENFETDIHCQDGTQKTIVWNTRGLRDNTGTVISYIAVGRDITVQKAAEVRAREGSRFLATMIDTIPIPIYFKDREGRYLGCNPPFEKYIGVALKDLVGKTAYDISPRDLAEEFTASDQLVFASSAPQHYEAQMQYAGGSRHDVIFYKASFLNTDGSVGGLIGTFLDITERKRMEAALLESETRLNEVSAMARVGGWELDVVTRAVRWTAETYRIHDISPDEHFDLSKAVLYYDLPGRDTLSRALEQCMESGEPFDLELPLTSAKGRHLMARAMGRAVHTNGTIVKLTGTFQDITEYKRAEEALLESESFNRGLVENLPEYIAVYGLDGKLIYVNPASAKGLGYDANKLVGTHVLTYIAEKYHDTVRAKMAARRDGGDTSPYEIEMVTRSGALLSVMVKATPILYRNNPAILLLLIDITDRKKADEAIRKASVEWHTTFDAITDVVFLLDDKGRIVRHNRAFETFTGKEAGEIDGRPCYEILHGTVYPIEGCPNVRAQESRQRESLELQIKGRWYMATVDPITSGTGTNGAVHLIIDITERKRVEELLRQNQMQLVTAMDLAVIVNWEYDVAFGEFIFDDRFYSFYGTTAEREGGNRMSAEKYTREFVYPDDIPRVGAEIQKLLETSDPLYRGQMEHRIIRRDGEIRTISARYAPVMDARGSVIKTFGANQDITEHKRMEEALRTSEGRLRTLLQTIPDLIWLKDTDGIFLSCNTMFERFFGAREADLVGKTDYDFVDAKLADFFRENDRKVMAAGRPISNEEWITFADDGHRALLETTKAPVYDARGGVTGVLGIGRDITERKQMEDRFRESQQIFADIISFLPDPTFVIDKDGKVLAWNRALEQLSGVPAGDIVGKGDYEYSLWQYGKRRPLLIDLVLHPDQDAGRMNYLDIHASGQTVTAQIEVPQAGSGPRIPLSLVASPLIDAEGQITGAIESLRDISTLKEAEAELARMNRDLEQIVRDRTRLLEEEIVQRMRAEKDVQAALDYTRSVIEANPDLIVVLDDKGTILDVNAQGELLTGISKDLLIGTPYFGYVVDDGTLVDTFSTLLRDGRIETIIQVPHTDHHVTPLSVHATVIRGSDGVKDRIIVSAHDITRQKQDEESIRASLAEKVLLLREVHHRVKNNLQIIISLVNLQMRQTDDPLVKQIMSEVQNRVRAMSLVHEKLYRSESLSRIDFADYTRFLATQLFSFYGTDSRRVHLDFAMGEIMVDINTAVPLGLIMNELISNALKHAFPQGREGAISIRGGDAGGLVTLVVHDNGIGIPADLDWRNTTTLGMRLITSLVDQIDGTVTMDCTRGTVFTIILRKKPAPGGA